jgi:hypothetical protein
MPSKQSGSAKTRGLKIVEGERVARRPITDDVAVKIAVARYSTHPPRSLEELSEDFDRDPVVISRTISRAL